MADVTMPQLGETVTEGTITRWFKQVGDQVAADETLFEVSTDKVDSEVPSPSAGYLAEILVDEGATVEVGATLAVLSESPPGGDGQPAGEQRAAKPREEAPVEPDESGSGEGREPSAEEAPAAPAPAPEPEPASGSASDDDAPLPAEGRGGGSGRLLSPVVRRLVAEHGLDLDTIEGTGAGGRITRNDVLAIIDDGAGTAAGRKTAPARAPASSKSPSSKSPSSKSPSSKTREAPASASPASASPASASSTSEVDDSREGDEIVPFSNIRRRTAEHMTRSLATSAHTLVAMEVDYEQVDRVRLAEKARFKDEEGVNLTYLPFVSRAVVDAIREFPHVNASVEGETLVVHRDVHLGIAVDLNFEGLMAPVVHGAGGKRLRVLAREIASLAARARSRKLGPDDIAGGTFTITNPGPFGTLLTGAIINQPQVAILATDGVRKRPVAIELADGSDAIAVHPVGNLAVSFDHRAVDGAYVSAFLARVREIVETRDWSAELA